jgi:predicted CoA-binding protein
MNPNGTPAGRELSDGELRELLAGAKTIAVVGLSPNADRPSNQVAWYLHHQGYSLYGVNPNVSGPVFGVPVVPSLADVPVPVDVVDVFRRASATPDVARDAVAAGARTLWLQLGVRNDEAAAIAAAGGLAFVQDRCLRVEHGRLLGPRAAEHGL